MYSRAEPCPPCPSAARRVPEVTKPLVPMVTCPQLPRPGTAPALPPLPPEEPPAGRAGIRTPGNSLPSVPSAQGMLRARLEGTRPGTARSCPLPVTGTSPSSPEDAPTPPHPPSAPTPGRRGSTEPPPATATSTPPSPGGPQEGPHLHTPRWAQPTPPEITEHSPPRTAPTALPLPRPFPALPAPTDSVPFPGCQTAAGSKNSQKCPSHGLTKERGLCSPCSPSHSLGLSLPGPPAALSPPVPSSRGIPPREASSNTPNRPLSP